MRSLRARVVGVMLGALVVTSLAGCAASPVPAPTPSSTPDAAAPLFASDEEALAAAEEAYAAYQAAFDVVSGSGGTMTAGLEPVAHGAALTRALRSAVKFKESAVHTTGQSSFTTQKVQSLEYSNASETSMSLYVCDDVSELVPLDEGGTVLREPDEARLTPFVISIAEVDGKGLVLIAKDLWTGASFC